MIVVDKEKNIFPLLMPFTTDPSVRRRRGILGVIRYCFFPPPSSPPSSSTAVFCPCCCYCCNVVVSSQLQVPILFSLEIAVVTTTFIKCWLNNLTISFLICCCQFAEISSSTLRYAHVIVSLLTITTTHRYCYK